jgi:hypothetical protein
MGDYDREPQKAPSQWLKLKGKDEEVTIRIIAPPIREPQIWLADRDGSPPVKGEVVAKLTKGQWATIMREPIFNISEIYYFVVIDRADGKAKIFQTTSGVYGKVRDYAQKDAWGDPKRYDISITRTENPGKNYYEVMALPDKSDPTDTEKAFVPALFEMLKENKPAARLAAKEQVDDIDENTVAEALPNELQVVVDFAKGSDDKKKTDEAPDTVTDLGDEPVNLDDIPF